MALSPEQLRLVFAKRCLFDASSAGEASPDEQNDQSSLHVGSVELR